MHISISVYASKEIISDLVTFIVTIMKFFKSGPPVKWVVYFSNASRAQQTKVYKEKPNIIDSMLNISFISKAKK